MPQSNIISNKKPYIAVVGGMVADIQGFSYNQILPSESNPGVISFSAGGVARNIAENLALLGLPVIMLGVIGNDFYGNSLLTAAKNSGIDVSRVLIKPNCTTAAYLALFDKDRNLHTAISDMAVFEEISADYLKANQDIIANAEIIVADTNMPKASLQWLTSNYPSKKIFIDPVSRIKAGKIKSFAGAFHTIKPNSNEAEAITGMSINSLETAEEAGLMLIGLGCHQCFISMAEAGVIALDREQVIHLPAPQVEIKSVSGAGDAFMAGLVYGAFYNFPLVKTAATALKLASLTLQSTQTISPDLKSIKL